MRIASATALLGLLAAAGSPAFATDPAGEVVDAAGRPVAGVKVSAIGRNWADPTVTASATTGPDGRFKLPSAWTLPDLDLRYLGLFARAPDGRCGWKGTIWRNDPSAKDLRIELAEGTEIRARLTDQDGKPLPDAPVNLTALDRSDPQQNLYDELVLPAVLASPFRARSDAEGRFVLKGIPRGVRLRAVVEEPRVGRPAVSWDPAKTSTLTLDRRLGEIKGRLVTPDGKPIPGKVTLGLRRLPAPPGVALSMGDFSYTVSRSAEVEPDGRFQFTGLPPGGYFVDLEFAAEVPYNGEQRQALVLEPGKPFKPVDIALRRLPVVTGRVIDEVSGAGIAGVELNGFGLRNNSLIYGRRTKTDASGKYALALEPGTTLIDPHGPPKTHLGMYRDQCPKIDVTNDRTWPDLKLARATSLDGRVVDPDGKPVAGARVHLGTPSTDGFGDRGELPPTGADGSFRLDQLDPTDTIPVRARTADAASDGPRIVRPSELDPHGKLTITVDPKYAARLAGRVVDQRGKPVAGAPVSVWWNRLYVSQKVNKGMGLGSILDQVRTGEDGRFRTQALWPGDRYHVTVDLKPYAKVETPQVQLSAGEVRDVGTIALVESTATLAGMVIGSDGKPIAGAEVFNRGDGPRPVSTRTGPDGRFRLEGLFASSRFAFARRDGFRYGRLADALKIAQRKYLFVRKDGYRFTGMAIDGEPDNLDVRLLKVGEPTAPPRNVERNSTEAERAFAVRTLQRLWDERERNEVKPGAWQLALLMSRADPSLGETWARAIGGRLDFFQKAAAEALAETDLDGALVLLKRTGNLDPGIMVGWAERLATDDPPGACRLATQALEVAKGGKNPADRIRVMARAGTLLASAGRVDEGRRLVIDAATAAETLGAAGLDGYARGGVAGALAPLDLKRATALIEPIKEKNEQERYLGFMIAGLARTEPAKALATLEHLKSESSLPQTLRTEIAFRLAPKDVDQAVKILEAMSGYNPEKHRAEGLGWLAVAIAPKDKARAFALIDRALDLPINKPEAFGSWTYFGGGLASAAGIALNARKIAYPDMDGVLMRVMVARPDGRSGFSDPAMQAQCQTTAAPLLALLDPAAAATVLGQLEARSGLSPSDLANVAGDWWLAAWALADLKHAEGVLDAQIEALKGSKNPDQTLRKIYKMVEILLTAPARREETLRREIGASWRPGFSED